MRYFFILSLLVLVLLSACTKDRYLTFKEIPSPVNPPTQNPPDPSPQEVQDSMNRYNEANKPIATNKPEVLKKETSGSDNDIKKMFACDKSPMSAAVAYLPFEVVGSNEGVGTLHLKGIIKAGKEEYLMGWGEKTSPVRLLVTGVASYDTPEKMPYEYFKPNPEYLTPSLYIDTQDGKTSFYLGVFNSGKFFTTADVSSETEQKIINSLKTGKEIELTVNIPFNFYEMGLPANYTSACKIE